jgi:uncharacterized protein (TIGR04255 family)
VLKEQWLTLSMGISFENPPLVELIAELRWGTPNLPQPPPSGMSFTIQVSPSTSQEEFFTRFADAIADHGFGRAERLVPAGFGILPFQPAYRFRKSSEKAGTTLYQIGTNVFSTNVTPPYQSWDAFRPTIKTGIEVLLETRDKEQEKIPFDPVALRYINAFDSRLTGGRSTMEFLSEVLGFRIGLPPSLDRIRSPGTSIDPLLRVTFPAESDYIMSVNLAAGVLSGNPAIVMDSSVLSQKPVSPESDQLLAVLDKAHDLIHDSFVEMTEKIHSLMNPRGPAK